MRILFISRSLEIGGAERQLVTLANGLSARGHQCAVAVFYRGGALESSLEGVELIDLKKQGRWDNSKLFFRLLKEARNFNPDIIHGYLGTPNLLTSMLRPFFPKTGTLWGVRASFMNLSLYGRAERLHYQLERIASNTPHLIVVNSTAGKHYALEQGFPEKKIVIIHNGIDTDHYRPDSSLPQPLREQWAVSPSETLVGLVARLDPIKNHSMFIAAAALALNEITDLKFICIGHGDKAYQHSLQAQAEQAGIGDRVVWTGHRPDTLAVYNALDICCSTSLGEGFSNVLAEAMACGTPCIATDVGDNSVILGKHGLTTPAGDEVAFAQAIIKMAKDLKDKRRIRSTSMHNWIVDNFGVAKLISNTEATMQELLNKIRK